MTATTCSFLAVFTDGTSRTGTTMVCRHDDFHRFVVDSLTHRRHEIQRLCYAWGGECQLYSGNEAREVFFGE